jgi:putative molybdopterin biosynthesis protein
MSNLRRYRKAAGLTQGQLADRAGVSRQLVGAAEAGRNLPRVDAAVALAGALGISVESLFSSALPPLDVKTGSAPAEGTLVRAGRVGDQVVTAPINSGIGGWTTADGVVETGTFVEFGQHSPGLVVVGCEPGLDVLERILRESGTAAMWVMGSSVAAIDALANGRAHAAVVHGPALSTQTKALNITRLHLASWQVGLAAAPDARSGWLTKAMSGGIPVVQREEGAGVQKAFETAASSEVPGPRAAGHLEAAERAVLAGMPAVTIEPAALAVGAVFEPFDLHDVEIWLAKRWIGEGFINQALSTLVSRQFQLRLSAVGGYDLSGCGSRVA